MNVIYRSKNYKVEAFTFPGGEMQVTIPDLPPRLEGYVEVVARVTCSNDLISLLLINQIVSNALASGIKVLKLPYMPYARQDRAMVKNQAFSLQVIAELINSMNFNKVIICDPHSDVTPALIQNIDVLTQLDCMIHHKELNGTINTVKADGKKLVFIAPDQGAAKKALKAAAYFGAQLITAHKIRDVATGEILKIRLLDKPPENCHAIIVDDICDGGATFTALARLLTEEGVGRIDLFVTHGIFSKGFEPFNGLIDNIFTTDAYSCIERNKQPLNVHISKIGDINED